MGKVQANTRLDQDTADTLEEHCDEMDLTKAEVLRRATRNYLDEHAEQDDDDSRERGVVRHGVSENIATALLALLAIFAGGAVWEAGAAFGDFITIVGGVV
jgi:metal-responsive CopG/Arc/MetJ family transcriptional regulator